MQTFRTIDETIRNVAAHLSTVAELPELPLAPVDFPLPPAPTTEQLAAMIDHTLLKPDATPAQIEQLCAEAAHHRFASVCVNPSYVALAAQLLSNTSVAVCTVVGFPLGATTPEVKLFETRQALGLGAEEIDMVLPVGHLKAGDYRYVFDEVTQIAGACQSGGALCKVILETTLLTDAEKVAACLLALQAGAAFVKTSTGFADGGATVADVTLMRRVVGPRMGVKASGGIRTRADAEAMVAAGASRLGASAGVQIVSAMTGDQPATRTASPY